MTKKQSKEKLFPNPGPEHIRAMRRVRNGADVIAYDIAKDLRFVERTWPGLITITEPMGDYDGAGQLPYFGAILTRAGKDLLRRIEAK